MCVREKEDKMGRDVEEGGKLSHAGERPGLPAIQVFGQFQYA